MSLSGVMILLQRPSTCSLPDPFTQKHFLFTRLTAGACLGSRRRCLLDRRQHHNRVFRFEALNLARLVELSCDAELNRKARILAWVSTRLSLLRL